MDYKPNADAVAWFATEILPLIRTAIPDARFAVVGANPSRQTQALGGVGRRDRHRTGAGCPPVCWRVRRRRVAPMRIARGIQNKVLEAMAMARPVVLTPDALEGIDATPGREVILAETASAFADACIALVQGPDGPRHWRRGPCPDPARLRLGCLPGALRRYAATGGRAEPSQWWKSA